jgi:hypothetical protein
VCGATFLNFRNIPTINTKHIAAASPARAAGERNVAQFIYQRWMHGYVLATRL